MYDFNEMIAGMTEQELATKLKQREGILQLCAIFLPVVGAFILQQDSNPVSPCFHQPGRETPRLSEFR